MLGGTLFLRGPAADSTASFNDSWVILPLPVEWIGRVEHSGLPEIKMCSKWGLQRVFSAMAKGPGGQACGLETFKTKRMVFLLNLPEGQFSLQVACNVHLRICLWMCLSPPIGPEPQKLKTSAEKINKIKQIKTLFFGNA